MPACVVKYCKNHTSRNKSDSGTSFHRFPTDPVQCDLWSRVIRRSRAESYWKPGKRTVICSDHFDSADIYTTQNGRRKVHKEATPKKALFLSSVPDNQMLNRKNNPVECEDNSEEPEIPSPFDVVCTGSPLSDYSDIESVLDSPEKVRLKMLLEKKTKIQVKHAQLIKKLRAQNLRLKKNNNKLKQIIKTLRRRRIVDNNEIKVVQLINADDVS